MLTKMLELLGRDIRSIILKFLTLGSKRALLQVSKSMYWWVKPCLRIATCPIRYNNHFLGLHCLVCEQREARRPQEIGKINHYVECVGGHRTVCHLKDARESNAESPCPQPGCIDNLILREEYCDGRKPHLQKKKKFTSL